jgi:anti-anti-sigma factor
MTPYRGHDPAPFTCAVVPEREVVRVVPVGELDIATAEVVAARVGELRAAGFAGVVLDLRSLTFIDAAGLGVVLEHAAAADGTGTAFELIAGPPVVQRVFELAEVLPRLRFRAP